jgi:uncharacterized protein (DUF1778 family)
MEIIEPRDEVVTIKVRPQLKRIIRQAARADGRTISSFLSFFLERVLVDRPVERTGSPQ